MAFVETLKTLTSILSSDLLIESRYDIMYNFNELNTYSTVVSAGIIQLATETQINEGDGFGAITPGYLSGSSLEYPLKYNTSFVTPVSLGADSSSLASVEYVDTEIIANAYDDSTLSTLYLSRTGDTGPVSPGFDLGDTVNKWDNVYAINFNGTATAALYSDLAEKYTCAERVEIGDVISIYDGEGDFEVQKSQGVNDYKIIGVVSEKPGFIMSQETDGPIVGLVGKVPVKVVGTCNKGDALVPSEIKGVAKAFDTNNNTIQHIIGFASEKKSDEEVALIKAIIK